MKSSLVAFLLLTGIALPAVAQDVVTVGSANASGSTVDIPVSIRDLSGTPLGMDKPAGSRIQSFSIKVSYAPASAVSSVTFTRAGITAGLTPISEFSPSTTGSISLLATFQESTNLIPFTLNAAAPGNLVAHLVFTLSPSAAPGSAITLTLDPSLTQLTDEGGSAATKETVANGGIAVVNGSISIPQLSLQLAPLGQNITVGSSGFLTVTASAPVSSDTAITLNSSATTIATVPPSVVIPSGARFTNFAVAGVALGTATITASLPASAGSGSASATVNIVAVAQCSDPVAPQLTAPATAQSGHSYDVSWNSVSGATEYLVDEATDEGFSSVTTQTVVGTSATYTHSSAVDVRYYYRVRARNRSGSCNNTSANSTTVSVLVTTTTPPAMRVLPVVGTTPGNAGSFFKTSLQLYNPSSTAISGKIVFHPAGTSGSSSDPLIAYSIAPRKTLAYSDLLPAIGISNGVGSADVIADATSSLPLTVARVFSDAGIGGTTGLAEESMSIDQALQSGSTGALIAPADVHQFRLNVGVRTLDQGVTMTVTVRDQNGATVKNVTKTFGATFFTQVGSVTFLDGYSLAGSESISFEITSGSAFIYGATTDNTTNDPSVQFARKFE